VVPKRWWERVRFVEGRPALAAILTTAFTLALVIGVVLVSPLRCGPARALGLKGLLGGCTTSGVVAARTSPTPTNGTLLPPYPTPFSNPYSAPYSYPFSAPYSNPASGPASGPFPPQSNPASPSGQYPPFYPPASGNGTNTSTLSLNCRVAVDAGPPGSGGFVVYPGDTFIADPSSNVTLPPGPTPPPPGYGYGPGYPGLSYDHAFSRWVPVATDRVSPDGRHYAYVTDGLYAVDVGTNASTELKEGSTWSVVGVLNDGVYAGDRNAGGLWFFPYSGTSRQITGTGYWQAATASAAYGTATSAVPQGTTNTILRLDLSTGKSSEWFTHPDTQSSVAGFDGQGHPILYVSYNIGGSEIWITTGAGSGSPIAGFSQLYNNSGFQPSGTPVADSHGVWFPGSWSPGYYTGQSGNGLALYVKGSGMYWMSSYQVQLAGGCY
jgi:hypothetical protein